jgi:hypothetical protein
LLSLQAGVVATSGSGNSLGTNRDGAVTGSRTDQGNITLDGIDVNDQAGGFAFSTVVGASLDTVQEFRTVTSNPLTTDGRSSGAQVQLTTKNGTNEWHGSARYFLRHDKTAANEWFSNKAGTPRPKLRRHQFGGSVGGPILHDKLFFFFDYEGRKDRSQFANTVRTVPLAHVLQGGVAYINNTAGCTASSNLTNAPQCITILTAAQVAALDPQGIGASPDLTSFLSGRYPVGDPSIGGDRINTGGHIFNSPASRDEGIYTNRVDYNLHSSHKLFGRWNMLRHTRDRTDGPVQQFATDPVTTISKSNDYGWVVGHTWYMSTRAINQATVGITKQVFEFIRTSRPSFPNSFTLGGLTAPFTSLSSQGRDVPVWTIKDDFNYVSSTHNFQAGFVFRPIRQDSQLTNDFNFATVGLGGGTGSLSTALRPANLLNSTTARSRWDTIFTMLLGRYASVSTGFNYDPQGTAFAPGTGKERKFKYDEYEFYFGDTWRVTRDLTVSYGVRWAYYEVPYERNGFQAFNDVDFLTLFDIRQANAAAGVAGPSAEPFLRYDLSGEGNNARGYYDPDLNNFAPRFSVAWNPGVNEGILGNLLGDRKTVIRFGGSVSYDRVSGAITFIQDQVSYIFDNTASTSFGGVTPTDALLNNPRFTGITTLPVANLAPTITRPFTPFVDSTGFPFGNQNGETNYTVAQNFRTPYAYNFSVSIQRDTPGNMIVEVAYVGRLGRKLFAQADAAQILDFVDPTSGQGLITAFNALQGEFSAFQASNPPPGTPFNATVQPWFENQMDAFSLLTFGVPCSGLGSANCTQVVIDNFDSLVEIGDLADTIQALYQTGLLDANVGLSGQFSTNAYITNLASSNYHGLLVSVRRRFSQGLQFDWNYTWSHAIDNNSSVTNTVFGGLVCDVRDLRVCRGNADFDVRHLMNSNWLYELPVGRGRRFAANVPTWLNQVIGGWDVSGIYTWRTGLAFSTTTGSFPVGFVFNSPGVGVGSGSALKASVHTDSATGDVQFFRDQATALAAFRNPRGGEIGIRNNLFGPHGWNVDLAVLKSFSMPWEGHRLQFRWEMFNAFNHPTFGLPGVNINGTTFGRITSTQSTAREMQFALRYDF